MDMCDVCGKPLPENLNRHCIYVRHYQPNYEESNKHFKDFGIIPLAVTCSAVCLNTYTLDREIKILGTFHNTVIECREKSTHDESLQS